MKKWIVGRDNVCPKPLPREISRVQSNNKICITFISRKRKSDHPQGRVRLSQFS
jgi:hypothetical protein